MALRMAVARTTIRSGLRSRSKPRVDLADLLAFQLRALELPSPVREFQPHAERKWRWDLAWYPDFPEASLLVDVQGGEHVTGSRSHGSAVGMANDARKLNAAITAGYRCLLFTGTMVRSGEAVAFLEKILR